MSLTMTISSWSAPLTTVTTSLGSWPIPPKISRYISATRSGVSAIPGRSGSSPIPSRISLTPWAILAASNAGPGSTSSTREAYGRRARHSSLIGGSGSADAGIDHDVRRDPATLGHGDRDRPGHLNTARAGDTQGVRARLERHGESAVRSGVGGSRDGAVRSCGLDRRRERLVGARAVRALHRARRAQHHDPLHSGE